MCFVFALLFKTLNPFISLNSICYLVVVAIVVCVAVIVVEPVLVAVFGSVSKPIVPYR